MPSLFVYLIKINAVLLVFAITYYLVLRRLTFYKMNRFFLLIGIVFSSTYPFINLTDLFFRQKNISHQLVQFIPSSNLAIKSGNYFLWNVLSLIFFAGIVFMSIRFIIQLISLYLIHKKSYAGTLKHYPVRILNENLNPFSFWKTIYINPRLHVEGEINTIIEHEKIHIDQWHTIDIILAELSVIFYWFNPGVWLIKKAVKENLEFITDAEILKKGIERKLYQYNLLKVETKNSSLALVNSFNISGLKKRIQMMNAKPSSSFKLITYFFLLPVLILFSLAFTVSKKQISEKIKVAAPGNSVVDSVLGNQLKIKSNRNQINVSSQPDFYAVSKTNVNTAPANSIKKKDRMQIDPAITSDGAITIIPIPHSANTESDIKTGTASMKRKSNPNIIITEIGLPKDTLPGMKIGLDEKSEVGALPSFEKNKGVSFNKSSGKVIRITKNVIANTAFGIQRKYYLNGQEISKSDLINQLEPEDIKEITIGNKDTPSKGVFINTK